MVAQWWLEDSTVPVRCFSTIAERDRCRRTHFRRAKSRLGYYGAHGRSGRFWPKAGRNLSQCMGLTQYEIPLDSRIADWVRRLPSPFPIDPKRLYAGIAYYES